MTVDASDDGKGAGAVSPVNPAPADTRAAFRVGAGGSLPLVVYALLVALCVALYLPGFTTIPPFDRDEARFAQASRQMLETGDPVDIRFQGETRYKKPVGIYWLQAAAVALLADDPTAPDIWTYRVPSALGATIAVLATAWAGTRLFGPAVGVVSAIMLASCVLLGVEARMAKTDAVLLACVVLAQGALAAFHLGRERVPGMATALLFWVALGVGFLIKGPLILLPPLGTIAILAVGDRSFAWLRPMRWRLGLAVFVVIVAPWLTAILIKTGGGFLSESVGHDMMAKVTGGREGKGLPPGYYLATFQITFLPWAFLTLMAIPWVWRRRDDPSVRFAIAWILPVWLVFEAVPTKLMHYTLPAFPALAMLTAAALLDPSLERGMIATHRRLAWFASGVGLLAMIALCVALAAAGPWLDGEVSGLGAVGVSAAMALYALAMRFAWAGRTGRVVAVALVSAFALTASAFALVLPALRAPWPSRAVVELVAAKRPCAEGVVASAGFHEPSLVFLLGTGTRLVKGDEAARHLGTVPACAMALVEGREEEAFRAGLAETGTRVEALGRVEGLNYNNGRKLSLTLYRSSPD